MLDKPAEICYSESVQINSEGFVRSVACAVKSAVVQICSLIIILYAPFNDFWLWASLICMPPTPFHVCICAHEAKAKYLTLIHWQFNLYVSFPPCQLTHAHKVNISSACFVWLKAHRADSSEALEDQRWDFVQRKKGFLTYLGSMDYTVWNRSDSGEGFNLIIAVVSFSRKFLKC